MPDRIRDLESLWQLDLSDCSKFEKFPEKGGNMKSLKWLYLKNTAIKDLPDSIGDLESLRRLDLSDCSKWLDLSDCSKFEKFLEKGGNMKRLRDLSLKNTAIKDLPDSIGDFESLWQLDLSDCSKFEKFPKKGGNMKSLKRLYLKNTAIKDLPDSIGDLESLRRLDISDCSKFEKFPEKEGNMKKKGGNMKSLKRLYLKNTAIKDLPDSIGDLESLRRLDLSDCSKFEKFPEKGGNMKSLWKLSLKNTAIKDLPDSIGDLESLEGREHEKFMEAFFKNTAIKDLPDSIGDLESLWFLDLSDCSKFKKFPEKGGNMKSLKRLYLKNTAIKDLPDSIGDLESLRRLDLSDCSKFEKFPIGDLESLWFLDLSDCSKFKKFPEKGGNMKSLMELRLKITAIKSLPTNISRLKNLKRLILGGCSDLWEGLISNQLCNLQKLNISQCKMAGQILVLPSSLKVIDARHCTSKEDLSGLLWLCHLNWLKSTTEELKCWKLGALIPESNGIPEWIRYQNMGSEVTTELPTNWYEDPDFLGFVVSCVYRHNPTSDYCDLECELNLDGNGFEFKDGCWFQCRCEAMVVLKI
ncbi:Protein PopC [Vitis vinifera]|uniref:Protein PopC n=1 Tax=Vitis vinifera TaxID=29760 RepID=A0A438G3A3_VITVI|nr:Protein PopC [Vitis vinifera]